MRRRLFVLAVILFAPLTLVRADGPSTPSTPDPVTVGAADWPWWRGADRNGIADAGQKPPLKWSASENVLWKSPVPGRGHGSPTVVGEQVFLATAETEQEIQSVLCFDRKSGKKLWQTVVHRGNFEKKGNKKASLASSTVACDGRRLFINFLNAGAIYTTALGLDGQQLWQTKITDYVIHQGYGSSPAIYQSLVIVTGDNKGGGAVAALERATGKVVWKHERPRTANYASPVVLNVAGRDQLLLAGCNLVCGFDPLSGKSLWEIKGSTTECVTTTVTDGQSIITSGGYPRNHVAAVRADGSGKVAWENTTRVYVPSMVIRQGHLYAVLDNGMATCWKTENGKELWKGRLGGTFSSSLVLVGENFFATSESGRTFIFKADPDAFHLVAENQLGDEVYATPAICGGRIYARVAILENGKRQEMLYCLGRKE